MTDEPNNHDAQIEAWTIDQLTKSAFFHRKLHDWQLLETADQITQVHGETLKWDGLHISEKAWNKVIHRGIKPVIVFAHPDVLQIIRGAAGYYRMLAMVSQKSMKRIGLNLDNFETGKVMPTAETALTIAIHLNRIISVLVESDNELDAREFDLWRGMAAGSQAQGSWQNNKGSVAEVAIKEIIRSRLQEQGIDPVAGNQIKLGDDRLLVFADEPDIAIYRDQIPLVAIEVKGGIDPAGVLERIGAALKSLRRTRQENPAASTILILQDVSMTLRAREDLSINSETVTYLFNTHVLLENESERERFFQILEI